MRLSLLLVLILALTYVGLTEAWFGGSSRNSNKGSKQKESRGFFGGIADRISSIGKSIANAGRRAQEKAAKAADFVGGAAKGTAAMGKAYVDMRDANWKNSDKYFHARGNHDAAKHGAGGKWAAEKISNAREWVDQNIKGDSAASSAADQAANKWGRSGGNPDKYRPKGLPKKFRK